MFAPRKQSALMSSAVEETYAVLSLHLWLQAHLPLLRRRGFQLPSQVMCGDRAAEKTFLSAPEASSNMSMSLKSSASAVA